MKNVKSLIFVLGVFLLGIATWFGPNLAKAEAAT
jgi:hypothetical protein